MRKLIKKDNGFTLLELLMVIIIIGLLAGLALPAYMKAQRRSYSAEAWANLTFLMKGAKAYYLNHDYVWTTDISLLNIDNPNSNAKAYYTYTIDNSGGGNTLKFLAWPKNASGVSTYVEGIECTNCGQANESAQRHECTTEAFLSGWDACAHVGG